eukprot:TRINITY_DN29310_c0_g1_i1.p1 TRINITY_DN29310_c0_g1~~TRINITY_DN29310_c0_g1_i1.p1  ORF type:complete len:200 (+),score=46.34 TRINITY_DN29310_c0_g1_i1:130-729(+)
MALFKDTQGNQCLGFWRPTDDFGYYGQWHMSDFVCQVDNLPEELQALPLYQDRLDVLQSLADKEEPFRCAEQFMMMGKAYLMHDEEIIPEFLKHEMNPKKQKALGRKVQNFDGDVWDKYCRDIVTFASYFKFSQDDMLKEKLISTEGVYLVEASPMDRIWGVGLKFDNPRIFNRTQWKGKNYLGECLMQARDVIIKYHK